MNVSWFAGFDPVLVCGMLTCVEHYMDTVPDLYISFLISFRYLSMLVNGNKIKIFSIALHFFARLN